MEGMDGEMMAAPEEEMEAAMEWISIAVGSCCDVREKGRMEVFVEIDQLGCQAEYLDIYLSELTHKNNLTL